MEHSSPPMNLRLFSAAFFFFLLPAGFWISGLFQFLLYLITLVTPISDSLIADKQSKKKDYAISLLVRHKKDIIFLIYSFIIPLCLNQQYCYWFAVQRAPW